MWNISVFCDDFLPGMPFFERALALLSELGIKHVELRMIDEKHLINMTNDEVLEVKKTLKKYGMKVGGLGTPIFKCPLRGYDEVKWGCTHGYKGQNTNSGSAYEDHLKLLPRAFEIADMLDAVNVRILSFWREYPLGEVFNELVEKVQKSAKLAKSAGHVLVMENEHNNMAGTGVELAKIVRAVGEGLTCLFDLGNSWRRGGTVYPDDFEALKGLISHLHIKHESIDIMPGNNTYGEPLHGIDPETQLGGFFRKCYSGWAMNDHKIKGRLNIDGTDFEIIGERTLVPVTVKLHYDHREFLTALFKSGYTGMIAVDSNFVCPVSSESEENIRKTLPELQKLINEILKS